MCCKLVSFIACFAYFALCCFVDVVRSVYLLLLLYFFTVVLSGFYRATLGSITPVPTGEMWIYIIVHQGARPQFPRRW